MAQQTINVGTAPNDGTGTPLRTAFQYTNSNFSELYTAVGPSGNNIVVPGSATITGDLTVKTNVLKVDTTNNRVGIVNASPAYPLDVIGNINTDSELYSQGGRLALYRTAGASYQDWASGQALIWRTVTSVGGAGASELMRLNSTGLGVGGPPAAGMLLTVGATSSVSATANAFQILSNKGTFNVVTDGSTNAAGTTIIYSWANGGQGPLIFRNAAISNVMTLDASGNVGIGVTPIERLTVAGTASVGGTGNIGVKFHSGSPVTGNLAWLLSNDSANSNILNLYYYNAGVFSGRAFVINQSGNFMVRTPSTPPTIPDNEMMVFNLTSNTNLRISVKGTDGTVRTANITLA